MSRSIIAEVYPWESRAAIMENDHLTEVFWSDQNETVGKIYKARVRDVLPGLSCAFVDIGMAKNAFLYMGDMIRADGRDPGSLRDLVRSGQDVLVQVKKEAFMEKGARVTQHITLPGHFLVLLPYQNDISISRKILGNQKRSGLRSLLEENKPDNMGLIVRTACLEAEDEEILADLRELISEWEVILDRFRTGRSPELIYEDIDVLGRTLRDYLNSDTKEIIINNNKLKERIDNFISAKNLSFGFEVKYIEGDLFQKYNLDKEIRKLLRRKVWLKSGGYLIFDETEAMTVIDVNSGKYTGKTSFEETVFRLNMEAAVEIPRQLKLRSIGGIILIDFIDMKDKNNEQEVIRTLKLELEKDKSHTRVMGMTSLGFLEMTRKKSRYGVSEIFTDECRDCHGRGRTISLNAVGSEVMRQLVNTGYMESARIICEVHPRLVRMLNEDRKNMAYIERRTGKTIAFVPREDLAPDDYRIYPEGSANR
ncbi:MAG: Rne/Rng family ribonuclease [Syntrophomonadaceae bacterium]|nr:Rne/Rng family ribonuclease [Syntrophomonadaceae bacterium]